MKTPTNFETMKASDVLTEDVLSVPSDLTLDGLALFFTENRVTGAPVVDGEGTLVGVVSETDLVRHQARSLRTPHDEWAFYRSMETEDLEEIQRSFSIEELPDALVADIMTARVISAPATMPIPELAGEFLKHRVHRILIVEDKKLMGIVTTIDMLKALARGRHARHAVA